MSPTTPTTSLAPDAAIDLQMHTTFSDGVWTAEQLVGYVASAGFSLIAVTDHDSPETTGEVIRLATEANIHALTAVEMSSRLDGVLLDLLCFGFDPARNDLIPIAAATRQRQLDNVREAYANLLGAGYALPSVDELAEHGRAVRTIGDLVDLCREGGYSENLGKMITTAGFDWMTVDAGEIVEAAHASGAVCLIAHPGRGDGFCSFDAPALDQFRAIAPVDGVEILHPTHSPAQIELYREYVTAHRLLASAGSDCHGKLDQQAPIKYPAHTCHALLERLGIAVGE